MRRSIVLLAGMLIAGCGGATSPAPVASASQVLTGSAELLELESVGTRQELFREVARASVSQAGRRANGAVLFPIFREGEVVAAPGFETRADLLLAPDAGGGLQLSFDHGERWPEERRESLQGLSEREVVELLARTLIARWNLRPTGAVQIDRSPGAPYAAAYMDGILRVNPAFLYLATAAVGPSPSPTLQ